MTASTPQWGVGRTVKTVSQMSFLIFLGDGPSFSTSQSHEFIQSSIKGPFALHARSCWLVLHPSFSLKPSLPLYGPTDLLIPSTIPKNAGPLTLPLVLLSLLTFMFHATLISYPFLSSKVFIPFPPIGPFTLTSPHTRGWNSLLAICVRIFLYISPKSTLTEKFQCI